MKTFKKLKEDIEITDKTGKALDVAQRYYKTYKNTRRSAPEIIKKGIGTVSYTHLTLPTN